MYKIIGADGAEYGPYSVDDLRNLILERRANAGTQAKAEGGGEWRPLASFPEFAEALQTAASIAPTMAISPAAAHYDNLRFPELCAEAWTAFSKNALMLVAVNLVTIILSLAIGVVPFVGIIASFVLFGPLFAGPAWFSLKLIRNEAATFGDAFVGFGPLFLPLMLCGMIYQIGVAIGMVLLVIPGLYLIISWSFPFFLVIDRKIGFWEALEVSRKSIGQRFLLFTGLFFFLVAIMICGAIPCGIGLLVAMPYGYNLYAAAYNKLFPKV